MSLRFLSRKLRRNPAAGFRFSFFVFWLKELFNFVLEVKGFVGWAEAVNDLAGSVDEEFSEVPEDEAGFASGSFV